MIRPARDEIPRYIIVSDFARIALHDLEPEEQRDLPLFDKKRGVTHEFPLAEFHRHVQHFAFIPGYKQHTLPQSFASAVKQRRRQVAWNEQETERLDRIRNPSKYLGK